MKTPMTNLTPPTTLGAIAMGRDVLFRTDRAKSYSLYSKVRDDRRTVVMRNARGVQFRFPCSMTCYRIFLLGQKYILAIPADDSLQRWEIRV